MPNQPHDDETIYEFREWFPWLLNHLCGFAESYPEKFDFSLIASETPDLYKAIEEKVFEIESLGAARASTIRRVRNQLVGLFNRADWRRKGLTEAEMALDENGGVRAILVTPSLPERSPEFFNPKWAPLGEFWATWEKDFQSPDGRPVFYESDFQALYNKSAEELSAIRLTKLQ